jgi:hypothetical protein
MDTEVSQQDVAPFSVCWICSDSSIYDLTRAMMDTENGSTSYVKGCAGRINGVNIIVVCLTQGPLDLAFSNQIKELIKTTQYVIYVGLGRSLHPRYRVGDVVITEAEPQEHSMNTATGFSSTHLQKSVEILRREVGTDGRWLRCNFSSTASTSLGLSHPTREFPRDLFNGESLHYESSPIAASKENETDLWDRAEVEAFMAAMRAGD